MSCDTQCCEKKNRDFNFCPIHDEIGFNKGAVNFYEVAIKLALKKNIYYREYLNAFEEIIYLCGRGEGEFVGLIFDIEHEIEECKLHEDFEKYKDSICKAIERLEEMNEIYSFNKYLYWFGKR